VSNNPAPVLKANCNNLGTERVGYSLIVAILLLYRGWPGCDRLLRRRRDPGGRRHPWCAGPVHTPRWCTGPVHTPRYGPGPVASAAASPRAVRDSSTAA